MKPRTWVLLAGLALAVGAGILSLPVADSGPPETALPQASAADGDSAVIPRRVVATYFHTTQRCASCRKIEAMTRKAIETGFAGELEDGRLVFRMINIDEKGNEHYVKDYKLFTKSVILSDLHSERETRWKNLSKVWELIQSEEAFIRYVQDETRSFLVEQP